MHCLRADFRLSADFKTRPVRGALLTAVLWIGLSASVTAQADTESTNAKPSTAETAVSSQETATDIREALTREADPIGPRPLLAPDGSFRALVAADIVSPPTLNKEANYFYTQLGIGSSVPIECYFYLEEQDLAANMMVNSNLMFDLLAKRSDAILGREVEKVDAGAVDGSPYLALSWLYRGRNGSETVIGQFKQRLGSRGAGSVYCGHNEAGYERSFARAFDSILASLQWATPSAIPFYAEVIVTEIQGKTFGVARSTLTWDAEGDVRSQESLSMLLPVDAQTLSATDSYSIDFSTPEGLLINQVEIETQQGEITKNLQFDPAEEGSWKVSGIFQGKELSAHIEAQELLSGYGQSLAMLKFLNDPEAKGPLSFPSWIPDADPTTILPVEMDFGERTDEGISAKINMASIVMDAMMDRQGSILSADIELGAITMTLRRIHAEGSLPTP